MTTLVGRRGVSDGVLWQITQPDDPGVPYDGVPRTGRDRCGRTRCFAPEIGQEAWTGDFWTLDFDAVREHQDRHSSPHFPAWARGQVGAVPSEVGPSVRFEITPEMFGFG